MAKEVSLEIFKNTWSASLKKKKKMKRNPWKEIYEIQVKCKIA